MNDDESTLRAVKSPIRGELDTRSNLGNSKKSLEDLKLGYNERKFVVLSAVAKFGEISAFRLAKELNISKQRAAEVLLYYVQGKPKRDENGKIVRWFKLEYLKRHKVRVLSRDTGKPRPGRPIWIYSLTDKGRRWLDRAMPLVQKGFPPRIDRFSTQPPSTSKGDG